MTIYDRTTVPESVGRGTLDPELAAWLPHAPVLGADEPVADARRSHRALAQGPWPEIGSVDTMALDGPHGTLPVRVHRPSTPASTPSGALVYLHGGGWTVGRPDEFEIPMRTFAERAGIVVYFVDYQLAPEAKFPTQLDECEHALRWVHSHAADEGVDPARIALGGDSAGGNMTCVLAERLRDAGEGWLALSMPLFPETALPFDTPAGSENRTGLYLETNGVFLFAWNLIPHGEDLRQPAITPLNGNVEGLAPTLLVTNGFDPLRDVGHAYARRLAEAGNDLTYVHHPDLTHGFPQFTLHSTACARATDELADLLRERIGR